VLGADCTPAAAPRLTPIPRSDALAGAPMRVTSNAGEALRLRWASPDGPRGRYGMKSVSLTAAAAAADAWIGSG